MAIISSSSLADFLSTLKQVGRISVAAKACKVSTGAIYRLRRTDGVFNQRVLRAIEEWRVENKDELINQVDARLKESLKNGWRTRKVGQEIKTIEYRNDKGEVTGTQSITTDIDLTTETPIPKWVVDLAYGQTFSGVDEIIDYLQGIGYAVSLSPELSASLQEKYQTLGGAVPQSENLTVAPGSESIEQLRLELEKDITSLSDLLD